ncbi:sarcosine oxidase [Roseateles sp. YR242]|uniref:N-methyl-L-tryptophan oxidase n=1 Tax=Roseateles sp. YR242 TaxID=1855305 RepID=UPI0008CD9B36|nr:N-methyl-L-tryptophan oxidase [Roseateles sp. YR242]SEK61691.1 sarcosine oxidase [Roseateles sp. YR242]
MNNNTRPDTDGLTSRAASTTATTAAAAVGGAASTADVIVIGLGAFGSATAWQLARRGAKVIGIDRFHPPHDLGSSHGATRITRLAVGEGEAYVPLVQASHRIWKELEAAHGEALYLPTGGLIMGAADGGAQHHGKTDFVQRTIGLARQYGITHELLQPDEVQARFPQFQLRGDELAYYEPESGVLKPERCVAVQLEAARQHGAALRMGEQVLAISETPGGVTVRTDKGTYSAGQVVFAAGPWTPGLVGDAYRAHLRVKRQVLFWFRPTEPALYGSPGCPIFIWMHGRGDEDYFYGFPMVDGHAGVKVASEQYLKDADPDQLQRSVSPEERETMFQTHVAGRLRSVTSECVQAVPCMYTVSDDSGFIVDAHPTLARAAVISACSGHGFKHSAGLGEAVAQHVLGEAGAPDLSAFRVSRFS